MTLILNGTDNSATTPAVTGTDTDTGVYYPAANQVALATNGTQAMIADASQNVGLSKSAPVARLHLAGSGTSGQVTSSFIIENTSSGTMGIDITGSAGSSVTRFRYGGGPSTGTNAMTGSFMTAGLEGVSAGVQGIQFAATQVSSANANTLDDYEEGTFTPNLVNNGGTSTWGVKVGRYTKVGAQINFWCYFDAGGAGSGGALVLSGLPFTGSGSGSTQSTIGTIVTNLGSSSTSWYPAFQSASASDSVIWTGGSQVINASINYCVVQGSYNAF